MIHAKLNQERKQTKIHVSKETLVAKIYGRTIFESHIDFRDHVVLKKMAKLIKK